jgi:hypothetical protein
VLPRFREKLLKLGRNWRNFHCARNGANEQALAGLLVLGNQTLTRTEHHSFDIGDSIGRRSNAELEQFTPEPIDPASPVDQGLGSPIP